MAKRIYISSDYSEDHGDREVVEELNRFASDHRYSLEFVDMARVVSGSVSNNPDCRPCDLKEEFNRQIRAASVAIFIVGDKTASRKAGCSCTKNQSLYPYPMCTPYKHNTNGSKSCKLLFTPYDDDNISIVNSNSYLQHEFEQALKCKKKIIIFYNSKYKMKNWLPSYMKDYEYIAQPFWIENTWGNTVGNYQYLKQELL